jgi:hypothetical protein
MNTISIGVHKTLFGLTLRSLRGLGTYTQIRNCLGRSLFGPKRSISRQTSPIFSSDAPHRTQKLARLILNCLLFGLKTASLNSYSKPSG